MQYQHKLRLAFVVMLLTPFIAWAQLPENCDTPDAPTPDVDNVAQATGHSTGSDAEDFQQIINVDTRYIGAGDTQYLSPLNDFDGYNFQLFSPNSVIHTYDTHVLRGGLQDTVTNPTQSHAGNIFSSFNVNAAFRDDMWADTEQATDFAQRTVHMLGGQFFAMSALESGDGLTRSSATRNELNGRYDKKYTIGSLGHAAILRGMTSVDEVSIIGSSHHASANFTRFFSLTPTVPS